MSYRQYPKRDAIRNYFPLPNEIFSLELSTSALAVYAYLLSLEDRKTYKCWPSYERIGRAIHKSKRSVPKYVDELVEKKLITVEPTTITTRAGQKRNGTLMYNVRPIQEAIDYNYEQQMKRLEVAIAREQVAKAGTATRPAL